MKHYFIITFDAESKEWYWDTDMEEEKFNGLSVWSYETNTWESQYQGDNKWLPYTEYTTESIGDAIRLLNETAEGAEE